MRTADFVEERRATLANALGGTKTEIRGRGPRLPVLALGQTVPGLVPLVEAKAEGRVPPEADQLRKSKQLALGQVESPRRDKRRHIEAAEEGPDSSIGVAPRRIEPLDPRTVIPIPVPLRGK